MTTTSQRRPPPGVRKGAVIAMYGAYVVGALAWMASANSDQPGFGIAAIACWLVVFAALHLLFHRTGYWRWGNAPQESLDEFEVASRNVAYRIAYSLVAGTTLLALLAERFAWDVAQWSADDRARDIIFWGWFLVVMTLPAAILAWTERPHDDVE